MYIEGIRTDAEGRVKYIFINECFPEWNTFEVPDDLIENKLFYSHINGQFILDIDAKNAYEAKHVLEVELEALEKWFAEYDIQCNQYRRCLDLNIEYDKDIMVLHNTAEEKAARIKEIRELI